MAAQGSSMLQMSGRPVNMSGDDGDDQVSAALAEVAAAAAPLSGSSATNPSVDASAGPDPDSSASTNDPSLPRSSNTGRGHRAGSTTAHSHPSSDHHPTNSVPPGQSTFSAADASLFNDIQNTASQAQQFIGSAPMAARSVVDSTDSDHALRQQQQQQMNPSSSGAAGSGAQDASNTQDLTSSNAIYNQLMASQSSQPMNPSSSQMVTGSSMPPNTSGAEGLLHIKEDPGTTGASSNQLSGLGGINVHPEMSTIASGNPARQQDESMSFNHQLQSAAQLSQGHISMMPQRSGNDDPAFQNFFAAARQQTSGGTAGAPPPLQRALSTGQAQLPMETSGDLSSTANEVPSSVPMPVSRTQPTTPQQAHHPAGSFDQSHGTYVFQPTSGLSMHPQQHLQNIETNTSSKNYTTENSPSRSTSNPNSPKGSRRSRSGWTDEETMYLMDGCRVHGVGNWKKILNDERYDFKGRTAVDLKDRFRTSFPEEYSRLYPNAKTHKSKRSSSNVGFQDNSLNLVKINRKERRFFTDEEDARLLEGFLKHGPAWSKIQSDPELGLTGRRSTDLRDRFRNAYPNRYIAAGYKGRSSSTRRAHKQQRKESNSGRSSNIGFGAFGDTSMEREQMQAEYKIIKAQNDQKFGKPSAAGARHDTSTMIDPPMTRPQRFNNGGMLGQSQAPASNSMIDTQFTATPGRADEIDMSGQVPLRIFPGAEGMNQFSRQAQMQGLPQIPQMQQQQNQQNQQLSQIANTGVHDPQLQQQQVGMDASGALFHPMGNMNNQVPFPIHLYYSQNGYRGAGAEVGTQAQPPQSQS